MPNGQKPEVESFKCLGSIIANEAVQHQQQQQKEENKPQPGLICPDETRHHMEKQTDTLADNATDHFVVLQACMVWLC